MRLGGLFLLLLVIAGCGKSSHPEPKSVADARSYAQLDGLRRSPHQGLQAELARLEDEQLTPHQLAATRKTTPAETMVAVRPDRLSVQAALREAYPALSRGMYQEQIERIDPDGDWRIGPVERELLRELIGRTEKHRERFRAALQQAENGFEIDPLVGPLAELEFFEPLELGCRLEGLLAVHYLADGEVADAAQSLDWMLLASERLAREPHVATRLLAAKMRAETLRLLQVIVKDSRCDAATLEAASQRIDQLLAQWPSDAQAWIGERASGLIVYEMVRDGHYLSLIDRQEVARLEKQHLLKTTARAVMGGIDEDQFFYLQSLRKLIESCDRPYCERIAAIAAIHQELAARESTQRYPIVAAMLLDDVHTVQRRQAEDLARSLAWRLALQIATGKRPPMPPPQNPLTGQPFVVQTSPNGVRLSGILLEADEPIEIPFAGREPIAP